MLEQSKHCKATDKIKQRSTKIAHRNLALSYKGLNQHSIWKPTALHLYDSVPSPNMLN